jgi:cytoskeletal protein CcmA (bactofilin family)
MHKSMKKVLFWLAKIFNVDLTVEKIVYRDVIVEVPTTIEKQVALEGVIEGDVTVKGNLIVEGSLTVQGEVTCYKVKGK